MVDFTFVQNSVDRSSLPPPPLTKGPTTDISTNNVSMEMANNDNQNDNQGVKTPNVSQPGNIDLNIVNTVSTANVTQSATNALLMPNVLPKNLLSSNVQNVTNFDQNINTQNVSGFSPNTNVQFVNPSANVYNALPTNTMFQSNIITGSTSPGVFNAQNVFPPNSVPGSNTPNVQFVNNPANLYQYPLYTTSGLPMFNTNVLSGQTLPLSNTNVQTFNPNANLFNVNNLPQGSIMSPQVTYVPPQPLSNSQCSGSSSGSSTGSS